MSKCLKCIKVTTENSIGNLLNLSKEVQYFSIIKFIIKIKLKKVSNELWQWSSLSYLSCFWGKFFHSTFLIEWLFDYNLIKTCASNLAEVTENYSGHSTIFPIISRLQDYQASIQVIKAEQICHFVTCQAFKS